MEYRIINNIFDLMQETIKQVDALYEEKTKAKNKGDAITVKAIDEAITVMNVAINEYHGLICNYVNSKNALIDDFDDEINEFLEENGYFNDIEDYIKYGYSDDSIREEKKEIFKDFIGALFSAVVDDDFNSNDDEIQTFIDGFDKLDLYLYILSK